MVLIRWKRGLKGFCKGVWLAAVDIGYMDQEKDVEAYVNC